MNVKTFYISLLLLTLSTVACFLFLSLGFVNTVSAADEEKKPSLDSFDITTLKIENGQSYLDKETGKAMEEFNEASGENVGPQYGIVFFIVQFIELLTRVIGSFALLFIIIGGFTLMVSHGSSQMQTRGKQMILYSLIGLAVAFMSLLLVTFVQSLMFAT